MLPRDQLAEISKIVCECVTEQYRIASTEVLPALEKEGILIRQLKDLGEASRKYLREMFSREIFPVLTPLAIDPLHPFPHLLNKSLNLVVLLQRPKETDTRFAVVQVPAMLPRFVQLPTDKGFIFTPLETAIRLHCPTYFQGWKSSIPRSSA